MSSPQEGGISVLIPGTCEATLNVHPVFQVRIACNISVLQTDF